MPATLSIDGSHQWFQDGGWHDLIVILDDVTSKIYCTQLVEDEWMRTVMMALRSLSEQYGSFAVLYNHFVKHRERVRLSIRIN